MINPNMPTEDTEIWFGYYIRPLIWIGKQPQNLKDDVIDTLELSK